jgi:hypothetical protein
MKRSKKLHGEAASCTSCHVMNRIEAKRYPMTMSNLDPTWKFVTDISIFIVISGMYSTATLIFTTFSMKEIVCSLLGGLGLNAISGRLCDREAGKPKN